MLAGLRIETADVDFGRKLIHVRRSLFDGEEQSPKSRNPYHWVPIDDELAAMLKDHIGDRRFGYHRRNLSCSRIWLSRSRLLCARRSKGHHLAPGAGHIHGGIFPGGLIGAYKAGHQSPNRGSWSV